MRLKIEVTKGTGGGYTVIRGPDSFVGNCIQQESLGLVS